MYVEKQSVIFNCISKGLNHSLSDKSIILSIGVIMFHKIKLSNHSI